METYLDFASNHPVLVGALLLSFFLVLFTELRRKASDTINIDPQQAVKLINTDAAVLDVRGPEAYAAGHVVGAKNIPFDELSANSGKIENMKSRPIVAVCQRGMTSTKAINELNKMGCESVYGIRGGMDAWVQAGLPVVSDKKSKKRN